MTKAKTAAVVLAAGLGTRMRSHRPKVMHAIAGRPMIGHLVAGLEAAGIERIVVVIAPGMDDVRQAAAPHEVAVQARQHGTADAALAARKVLKGFDGDVLVINGDTPLVGAETIHRAFAERRSKARPTVVVIGFRSERPAAYGRLVLNEEGGLERIVEAKDATPEELAIGFCNGGVMVVDGRRLFALLDKIGNDNAKGEYYLTDIVAVARSLGLGCAVVEGSESELMGINSRAELGVAEAVAQEALRARAMEGGATLRDPNSVHFSFDTRLGRDVTVGPFVVFGPGVVVGDNVEIVAFCHMEFAEIATGARVGPFARLRPGARLGEDVHIGNFVEVKASTLERGAKANHLAYIGDARVGAGANVGAGTITCNYDGFAKYTTDIGAGAFIGSNTSLVAPVTIGEGALIGAGSVITRDVPADALALERAEQRTIEGGAAAFRRRKTGGAPKRRKTGTKG